MFTRFTARHIAVVIVSLLAGTSMLGASLLTGVSLAISREVAPPGGLAQIKVSVTEPRPISTGSVGLAFADFNGFDGIAAISPENDTFGVAQVNGSHVAFTMLSTSSSLGTDSDYPILTVAARVPSTASLGTVMPVSFAGPAIQFLSPTGSVYPTSFKDGSVTVGGGISIEDVQPGSADLKAGSIVTIVGRGFTPTTKVRFNHTLLSSVRYIDATHIQVVLAAAARMHGMRIRAENRDGSKTTYFSYQRTSRQGTTTFLALQNAVPLFPLRLTTLGRVDVTGVPTAIAVQNIADAVAPAAIDLLTPDGRVLATTTIDMQPNRFVVKELSELFGVAYVAPMKVRVRSSRVPIQVMGIGVDAAGTATPIVPH
jgi:hypothetical protein